MHEELDRLTKKSAQLRDELFSAAVEALEPKTHPVVEEEIQRLRKMKPEDILPPDYQNIWLLLRGFPAGSVETTFAMCEVCGARIYNYGDAYALHNIWHKNLGE